MNPTVGSRNSPFGGGLLVEAPEIFYVHEGRAYMYFGELVILAGQSLDLILSNGENSSHIRQYIAQCDTAPIRVKLFEDPVFTGGVEQLPIHMNRIAANQQPSTSVILTGATVTDTGTPLDATLISGSKQSGGFGNDVAKELVTKPNSKYLARITNETVSTATIVFKLFWIEFDI